MKKIAIIGGGTRAIYIADACKRLGVQSHCFSLRQGLGDVIKHVDFFHEIDIFDIEKLLLKCKELSINGVCATTEMTLVSAAKIADALHLNCNSVQVAKDITNKYINRKKTNQTRFLLSPKFAEVSCYEELLNLDFRYPIILKPEALVGGKKGIVVVKNKGELFEAFKFTHNNVKVKLNEKILVEEFIQGGQEYSVESLSYNKQHYIIQVTEKDSDQGTHCVELGHHQPACLSPALRTKVEIAIRDGLDAIGMEFGPCHSEIKILNEDIYLIEFNARPGGDHISWPLVELSTGYPYIEGVVKIALDEFEPIDVSQLQKRFSGIYYVTEQTKYLKPVFDICEKFPWCWEKHFVSDNLEELTHNDIEHTNYFIYSSDDGNPVPALINKLK